MKKILLSLTVLFITSAILPSCKKKDECTGGSGGNLTIVARPQHHGVTIPNQVNHTDTIYVKYNTQDKPGENLSSYDAVFVGEAGEDHVHVEGLQCGNYYLYAAGYDTTIHQRVTGGIPYSTSQKSGEIELNIPVTE